ncbi:MAG: kelch repeat-containing protein [Planctomycetota bacterium]
MSTSFRSCRVLVAATTVALPLLAVVGFPTRAPAQCPPVWTPASPATSPVARYGHAMAYDSRRGVTVLFGGGDNPNSPIGLSDTWEWNGATWTQRTPVTTPPGRLYYAMAYDSARGVTVLFGGIAAIAPGIVGDTWEWDGTNWAVRTPATSPSARYGHAMVFDSARGKIVLFGGSSVMPGGSGSPLGDTWEWNGTNWTQRAPATVPSVRYLHVMAYDNVRGVTVLFGGSATIMSFGAPSLLADTWEWNGTNWGARTPPAAPSARCWHTMAYGTQGTTVLFGGYTASGGGDTWQWNGTNWTQPTLPLSPPPRIISAMAYDSARGAMVLFGGALLAGTSASLYNDTWELQDTFSFIVQQPVSTIAAEGFDAAFGVTAQGSANFTYQWRKEGVPIPGADMAFLRIHSVREADAGSYDVVVTAGSCPNTSTAATLTVRVLPCGPQPGDFDADGDVDLSDFLHFQACFNDFDEPPATSDCEDADFDRDGDVDLGDFQTFRSCFNGPN